jgi:hypothetical protein
MVRSAQFWCQNIVKKVKYYESHEVPKQNVKEVEYTEINVEK